jgi:methionyl-tRNA formyltransferase
MGLKVFILASRKTGYEVIKRLLKQDCHKIVGVVFKNYEGLIDDDLSSNDFRVLLTDFKDIPYWEIDKIHEPQFIDEIREIAPDIGLSIGWRRLVKEPVISLPKLGFFNFHASDLPRYRGFASTSWAIINGEKRIPMTVHRMIDAKADHGDIYLKKYFDIHDNITIKDLFDEITAAIPDMVLEFLDGLDRETLTSLPQNEADALYSFPRHPCDGWIDWSNKAIEIDRLVRAVAPPYPGAFTCLGMEKISILSGGIRDSVQCSFIGIPGSIVATNSDESVNVLTGNGIYTVTEIKTEAEASIPPGKLVKGVQQRFGLSQEMIFEFMRKIKEMS